MVNPLSKNIDDMATPRQITAIIAIAKAHGVDPLLEARCFFNLTQLELSTWACLSRTGASALIGHLKKNSHSESLSKRVRELTDQSSIHDILIAISKVVFTDKRLSNPTRIKVGCEFERFAKHVGTVYEKEN